MSDLLNHLVSRSITNPASTAILQPRLPSIYELPHTTSETPLPSAESSVRETSSPVMDREQETFPEKTGLFLTQENSVPQIQPGEPAPRLKEMQQSIFPVPADETSMTKPPMLPRETQSAGDGSRQSESSLVHPQKEEQEARTGVITNNPSKIITKLIPEDRPVERVSPPGADPMPTKPEREPVKILQPILPISHPLGTQPSKSTLEPEPQQVVEIHIGRIEVRATPAPNNPPAKPRSASIMTLDEYLQRRRAGDRG